MRDHDLEIAFDAIERLRGEPPPTQVWELAIKKRYVSEYLQGDLTLPELDHALDELEDTLSKLAEVRRAPREDVPAETPKNFRRWAINEIFAIEAAESDEVEQFRSEWLDQGLLGMDEVSAWIAGRKSAEGPSSMWVTVLADDDGHPIIGDSPQPGYRESGKHVKFVDPDERWIRSEAVNAHGALIELATIAESLHRRYDWSEAWAATFVLTGVVPPAIVANHVAGRSWPWARARRRLTITVRLDVQPSHVMNIYRQERNKMLEGEPLPRSIGESKARLGVFAAAHSVGYTWAETMHVWNRENRDRQFSDEARFTRDSRDAFNRIMGEPLNWAGKNDSGRE